MSIVKSILFGILVSTVVFGLGWLIRFGSPLSVGVVCFIILTAFIAFLFHEDF